MAGAAATACPAFTARAGAAATACSPSTKFSSSSSSLTGRGSGWSSFSGDTSNKFRSPTRTLARAQPGEPPLWSRFVYVGLGRWACFPPGETLGPRVYSFVPTTNKKISITKRLATRYPKLAPLSALGHINSHIQMSTSRTSPFICFGAHQQPNSTILTLVTIPDASFSESKARCRIGE